ncbi:MFS transporter [Streptomyces hesseae]|uniref:MFS transporter n=1 Tax=Streptomyces hesseae TaxID=3075519 RepID=A0ABU2SHB9_9ACTN|nr:MFS transporter [Streptomyces sp. DSM 40473]MDT0448376.1 MFS transporter [Streptomyces sp. DSM 40473]
MSNAPAEKSLWRHPDFVRYWSACAVDIAGSGVTAVALPLIAVVSLHATVWQVSLLSFAERLPPLLVALPAGALADRHRKRPLMIGAVLACGTAFAAVPIADAADCLTLELLYAVALVTSAASLIGSTPRISYLPSLLPREQLLEANAKVGAVASLADSAGAQLGGAIVAALGAARAVYADVASYLACALLLGSIRTPEPAPDPSTRKGSLRAEIVEGVRYVVRHPTIRPLLLTGTAFTAVFAFLTTLWTVYLLRELHYAATTLGTLLSVAALGGVVGALAVRRLVERYGPIRVMLTALAIIPFTELPLLLATPGLTGQATIAAGMFVQLACSTVQGSTQRSIRQTVCAPGMQGRMLATGQWITYGTRPLAALLAGATGTWLGLWNTLALGTAALTLPFLVLHTSSTRTLHHAPATPTSTPGPPHAEGEPA